MKKCGIFLIFLKGDIIIMMGERRKGTPEELEILRGEECTNLEKVYLAKFSHEFLPFNTYYYSTKGKTDIDLYMNLLKKCVETDTPLKTKKVYDILLDLYTIYIDFGDKDPEPTSLSLELKSFKNQEEFDEYLIEHKKLVRKKFGEERRNNSGWPEEYDEYHKRRREIYNMERAFHKKLKLANVPLGEILNRSEYKDFTAQRIALKEKYSYLK